MPQRTSTSTALIAVLAALTTTLTACGSSTGGTGGDDTADYPTDQIRFLVPYPAGSGPDAGARVIASQLETELGQSVVVENREGGSSTIGLLELSTSEPDGYTIGLGSFSGISIQSRIVENPFEGLGSLTPVAQTKDSSFMVFAPPDKGWDSIEDFVQDAKSQPGELTVGVPNRGSVPDVLVSLLEEAAGIELEHVYYDAGQQILPVVNGTTDLGVAQGGPVVQFIDTGQLDFVGVFGEAPEGIDAESFDDAGYDTSAVQDFEGVFGPADLPDDVTTTLSDAVGVAVESEEFQELMRTTFNQAAFVPADEFAQKASEQDEAVVEIIDTLGLAQ